MTLYNLAYITAGQIKQPDLPQDIHEFLKLPPARQEEYLGAVNQHFEADNQVNKLRNALNFLNSEQQYYDDIVEKIARGRSLKEIEKLWPQLSFVISRTSHPTVNISPIKQHLLSARGNYMAQLSHTTDAATRQSIEEQIERINARLAEADLLRVPKGKKVLPIDEFNQQIPLFANSAETDARAIANLQRAFYKRFQGEISITSPIFENIILYENMWGQLDNDRSDVDENDALSVSESKSRIAFFKNAKGLKTLKSNLQRVNADPDLINRIDNLRQRIIATANHKGHELFSHMNYTADVFANSDEYIAEILSLRQQLHENNAKAEIIDILFEPIALAKRIGFHLSIGEGRHNVLDVGAIADAVAKQRDLELSGLTPSAAAKAMSKMFEELMHAPEQINFETLEFTDDEAKAHAHKVWKIFKAYAQANQTIDPNSIGNAIIAECDPNRPYLVQTMQWLSKLTGANVPITTLIESDMASDALCKNSKNENFLQRYYGYSKRAIIDGIAKAQQFFAGSDMLRLSGIAGGTYSNNKTVSELSKFLHGKIIIFMGVGHDLQRSFVESMAEYRKFLPNGLLRVKATNQGIGFVDEHGVHAVSVESSAKNLGTHVLRNFGYGDDKPTKEGNVLFKQFAKLSKTNYQKHVYNSNELSPVLNVIGKYWSGLNLGARGGFGRLDENRHLGQMKELVVKFARAIGLSGSTAAIGVSFGGIGSGHAFHKTIMGKNGQNTAEVQAKMIQKYHDLYNNNHGFKEVFKLLQQHVGVSDFEQEGLSQFNQKNLKFAKQDLEYLKKYMPMILHNNIGTLEVLEPTISPARQPYLKFMRNIAFQVSSKLGQLNGASTLEATSEAGRLLHLMLKATNVIFTLRGRVG